MNCISLYRPWALFIMLGWKEIETRLHSKFASLKGQEIGIYATKEFDFRWAEGAAPYLTDAMAEFIKYHTSEITSDYLAGKIICTAFVYDALPLNRVHSKRALINCSLGNRFGLFLRDIKQLTKPIEPPALTFKRGIWKYERKCRICGCIEENCKEWIQLDLCSACLNNKIGG